MTAFSRTRFVPVLILSALTAAAPQASAEGFFARAEDMGSRQAWTTSGHTHGGYQALGYDFDISEWDDESATWQMCVSGVCTANRDHHIWNKPVFASSAGRVVRCWRTVEDNPTLGQNHPEWQRMMGGGNFLFVEEDDGELILYAHFRQDTIPERLCPLSPNQPFPLTASAAAPNAFAPDSDGDVPTADQARVEPGDFLGCVGNSGNSSRPHLHLSKSDTFVASPTNYGSAADMRFDFFQWRNLTDGIDTVSTAMSTKIPDAPVAVSPPPETRSFGPLAASTTSIEDMVAIHDQWREDGIRISDFESYLSENGTRIYMAIGAEAEGPGEFVANLFYHHFISEWQSLEGQGLRLDDVEIYEVDGPQVWSGVFVPGIGATGALIQYDWQSFLAGWSDLEAAGMRLHDHESGLLNGERVYTGIFRPAGHSPSASFGVPFHDFALDWASSQAEGEYLHDVEMFRTGGLLAYNGVFEPSPAPNQAAWIDTDEESFFRQWARFDAVNYRIHDLEVHEAGNGPGPRFSGIFLRQRTPTPCDPLPL